MESISPLFFAAIAFHAGFVQQIAGQVIGVWIFEHDATNTGIDNHFGAGRTRLVRTVNRRIGYAHSVKSGLHDGILFRMKAAAQFVALT